MKRRHLAIFLGRRKIEIPNTLALAVAALLLVSVVLSIANLVVPWLTGSTALIEVPSAIQTTANVLSYLTGIALLIGLMLGGLALQEHLAHDEFAGILAFTPLSVALGSTPQVALAPNLDPAKQILVLNRLELLLSSGKITSAHLAMDELHGTTSDRVLLVTSLPDSEFRRATRSLRADRTSRLRPAALGRLSKRITLGQGTPWILLWD